jgi:hypothetical protein
MSSVDLKLDETNELVFKIDITGSDPIDAKPVIRFMCEADGIGYSFEGEYNSSGEVEVEVPAMEGKIKEGTYKSTLEVILENKIFFPLSVDVDFRKSTQVVAEIVSKKKETSSRVISEKISASMVAKPKRLEKTRVSPKKSPLKKTLRAKFGED